MEIIDEEGNLFGAVNIIDVLVVLLVVAVITAGLALVLADNDSNTTDNTATVTVNLQVEEVQPYVADAIRTENISEDITITGKSVSPSEVVVTDADGEFHVREHPNLKTVGIQAELRVEQTESGPQFRGNPLRVGTEISIDTGRVSVTGTVVEIQE